MPATPQPTPTNEAAYGTLEYYQEALNSDTSWVWLEAARDLADKALTNFQRVLAEDYATTLGIDAADTDMDEAMIADVEAECAALHAKIIRDCQTARQEQVNQVKDLQGDYMSPVVGLFKIATLDNSDPFLDIATLEDDFSLGSMAQSTIDGPMDKYGFNIDDPIARQYAIKAIMSETDITLYKSQVRT